MPAAAEVVVEMPGDVPVVAGVDRLADQRQPARRVIVVMEGRSVGMGQAGAVAGRVVVRCDRAERPGLGDLARQGIPGERQRVAGLACGREPVEVVVGVGDVGVRAGQVLERHAVQLVERESDVTRVPQPALGDVGSGVVGQLLVVGRRAGVRALGRHREPGL